MTNILGLTCGKKERKATDGKWEERDGVIYINVPLTGTGKIDKERIQAIKERNVEFFPPFIEDFLLTGKELSKMKNGRIVILRGKNLELMKIRKQGAEKGFIEPSPDMVCCLAETLSIDDFREMGLDTIIGNYAYTFLDYELPRKGETGVVLTLEIRHGRLCISVTSNLRQEKGGYAFIAPLE